MIIREINLGILSLYVQSKETYQSISVTDLTSEFIIN